jgi:hypothetical protein
MPLFHGRRAKDENKEIRAKLLRHTLLLHRLQSTNLVNLIVGMARVPTSVAARSKA